MADRNKTRARKRRINNLSKLGLEPGKIYQFNGRFRKLYKEPNSQNENSIGKIRKGDHVVFFNANLWRSASVKTRLASNKSVKFVKRGLEKEGYKILREEKSNFSNSVKTIVYKNLKDEYSGMLYVGFKDKFGWINIVQMSEKKIKEQFNKVEICSN